MACSIGFQAQAAASRLRQRLPLGRWRNRPSGSYLEGTSTKPPLALDARVKPGPWSLPEGIAQGLSTNLVIHSSSEASPDGRCSRLSFITVRHHGLNLGATSHHLGRSLVESLISLMEVGTTPWRREWDATTDGNYVNLVTSITYCPPPKG